MSKRVPVRERPLIFIDTECTGLVPQVSEVISFAAEKWEQGTLTGQMNIKIRPEYLDTPPPWAQTYWTLTEEFSLKVWKAHIAQALDVNGYSEGAWEGALDPKEALPLIMDYLKGSTVSGQNVAYDIQLLEGHARNLELRVRLPYHKVDLVTLAYEHLVPLGLRSLSLTKEGGDLRLHGHSHRRCP